MVTGQLFIRRNYLSREKCQAIVDAMLRAKGLSSSHNPNRIEVAAIDLKNQQPGDAYQILKEARNDVVERVTRFYEVTSPVWNEFTLLSGLHGGEYHSLHADNEKMDANGRWVPNHTPWRNFTGMLYLNTSGRDFHGGHIRFTQLERDIAPVEGLLVGFGCDHVFLHETTPVTEGTRYAVSFWMTSESGRAERW